MTVHALAHCTPVYSSYDVETNEKGPSVGMHFSKDLFLFFTCICMLLCAPHVCLVATEAREAIQSQGPETTDVHEHHVDAENSNQVLCKSR